MVSDTCDSETKPRVALVMRKPLAGQFSMDRAFTGIVEHFGAHTTVELIQVPHLSLGLFRRLANILFVARLRADVVHIAGDINYCVVGVKRRKVVLTVHDFRSVHRLRGWRGSIFSLLWFRLPLWWSGAITVDSIQTGVELAQRYPSAEHKVVRIPMPIGREFFDEQRSGDAGEERPRVLQIGTGANKNLSGVVAALEDLPLELRIVGRLSDGQREELDATSLEFSAVADLTDEQILGEYRDADLLVFASTFEGFGMPIIEAQAFGLPVVTSGMEPMLEVSGGLAHICDPHDPASIRGAVLRALGEENPSRRQRLAAARSNAEKYRSDVVAKRFELLYRDTARRAGSHPRAATSDPQERPGHMWSGHRKP